MKNKYKPLHIRAYMQTGIISDQFLPLDGIMYYFAVRKILGFQTLSIPGKNNIPDKEKIILPLKKKNEDSDKWFYQCSFAQWPENTIEDSTFYVKRFDLQFAFGDMLQKTKKVTTKSGRFKNYHVQIYYRHALYVDWYCVGLLDEIKEILRFCTHIGKKTAQGWGAVLKWEVNECKENWSIYNSDDKLMRGIPSKDDGFLYGIRPSYWENCNIFKCKMPDID